MIDSELSSHQECVTLIQKLCVDLGSGLEEADKLISNVTLILTDAHSEREVRELTLAVSISVQGLDCTDLLYPFSNILFFYLFVSKPLISSYFTTVIF